MIFIGGGALLSKAVDYTIKSGITVDAVCCPIADKSIPRLKRLQVSIMETNNPSADLTRCLDDPEGKVIFSINNRYILDDRLLSSGAKFFNIHNGLVQSYRGISEVCVFAAICKSEPRYGVTLHELRPNQCVDSGPVVAQLEFAVSPSDNFFMIMMQSLDFCHKIFKNNLEAMSARQYQVAYIDPLGKAYSYKDVPRLCKNANPDRLSKAKNFGFYESYFPKLAKLVDSMS